MNETQSGELDSLNEYVSAIPPVPYTGAQVWGESATGTGPLGAPEYESAQPASELSVVVPVSVPVREMSYPRCAVTWTPGSALVNAATPLEPSLASCADTEAGATRTAAQMNIAAPRPLCTISSFPLRHFVVLKDTVGNEPLVGYPLESPDNPLTHNGRTAGDVASIVGDKARADFAHLADKDFVVAVLDQR